MSDYHHILDVFTPTYGQRHEELEVPNCTCATCFGHGTIVALNERQKCKVCNGTGKLKAKVTINWEPQQ